MSRSRDL